MHLRIALLSRNLFRNLRLLHSNLLQSTTLEIEPVLPAHDSKNRSAKGRSKARKRENNKGEGV
jgi:hypothetical protein